MKLRKAPLLSFGLLLLIFKPHCIHIENSKEFRDKIYAKIERGADLYNKKRINKEPEKPWEITVKMKIARKMGPSILKRCRKETNTKKAPCVGKPPREKIPPPPPPPARVTVGGDPIVKVDYNDEQFEYKGHGIFASVSEESPGISKILLVYVNEEDCVNRIDKFDLSRKVFSRLIIKKPTKTIQLNSPYKYKVMNIPDKNTMLRELKKFSRTFLEYNGLIIPGPNPNWLMHRFFSSPLPTGDQRTIDSSEIYTQRIRFGMLFDSFRSNGYFRSVINRPKMKRTSLYYAFRDEVRNFIEMQILIKLPNPSSDRTRTNLNRGRRRFLKNQP